MSITNSYVLLFCLFPEINSTFPQSESEVEGRTAALEDVLYQKGASFSARLDETNGHVMDNSIDNEVQSGRPSRTTESVPATHRRQPRPQRTMSENEPHVAPSREYLESLATIANNENYYSDMSMFDDVNNNRLNLPLINDRFTVRQVPERIINEVEESIKSPISASASVAATTTINSKDSEGSASENNTTQFYDLNTMPTTVTTP